MRSVCTGGSWPSGAHPQIRVSPHSTVLTVLCCTLLHSVVLCCTVLYCTAVCYAVLCFTPLYCTVMCCRFKDEDERQPVSAVVETAFPALLGVLKHLIALQSPSLEVADFIKLILKTFWSVCYVSRSTQDNQLPLFH